MRAWVVLVVAGCGRIGFDHDRPGDGAVVDVPTTFDGPKPDPQQLPLATGQVEPLAPPGATLTAGESYLDPTTGVRIWKLTDASFPMPNDNVRLDRSQGGSQVSAAWDGDHHTIAMTMQQIDVGTRYLIDLQRGIGTSNARALVQQGGEDGLAFTTDPTNPRILFAGDFGRRLHRIDSATNMLADVTPLPLPGFDGLLQVSAGGRSVVAYTSGEINDGFKAVDLATGVASSLELGNNSIPVSDRDGLYVTEQRSGPSQLWRIGTETSLSWQPPTGDFAESTGVTGGFVALDVDTGSGDMTLYLSHPATATHEPITTYGGYDSLNLTSHWIQTDVGTKDQWILVSVDERGFTPPGRLDDAVGFWRLDGELRILLHHHTPDNATYYLQTRAGTSPDGRIVVFTSTMGTGRTDVYAAEVPLTP